LPLLFGTDHATNMKYVVFARNAHDLDTKLLFIPINPIMTGSILGTVCVRVVLSIVHGDGDELTCRRALVFHIL
jgi:hypothetical protein